MAGRSNSAVTAPKLDARVARTRVALHDALLSLAAEQPFETLTAVAIAQRAGVGYATFFRHYPDKEALLAAVAEDMVTDLTELVGPLAEQQGNLAGTIALTRYIDERRPLCHVLFLSAGERVRQAMFERARAWAQQGAVVADWLPRGLAVTHLVSATLNALSWWLEHGHDINPVEMARIIDRLVTTPAVPD